MKDEPTRILLLYKYLDVGGVATHIEILSKLLIAHDYEVYVATSIDEKNQKTATVLKNEGVSIIALSPVKNRVLAALKFLYSIMRSHKKYNFDIIHSHHRLTNAVGKVASLLLDIPLVSSVHEFKSDQKITTKFWKHSPIIVPSKALKSHLKAVYQVADNNIHVILNVLNPEFKIDSQKRMLLKKNHFHNEKATYVGFIGRIAEEKGIDVLIESMPMIKEKNHDIEFRIVGDGPMLSYCKKQCRKLGFNPDDIFLGTHFEVNELLSLFDICVSPSRSESFSIFALEAMRAAKPIVATRVGGLPEVVISEKTGYLVEKEDHRKLAEKILLLAENSELRARMGKKGAEHFQRSFSTSDFYKQHHTIYQTLQ